MGFISYEASLGEINLDATAVDVSITVGTLIACAILFFGIIAIGLELHIVVITIRVASLLKKAQRPVDDECAVAGETIHAIPMKSIQVEGHQYTAVPVEYQFVQPQAPIFLQQVSI